MIRRFKAILFYLNRKLRAVLCRLFGHSLFEMSIASVGLRQCARCLRVIEPKTSRRRVTYGDVERRMADNPPPGYRFVRVNWKKRRALFVSPTGKCKHVRV